MPANALNSTYFYIMSLFLGTHAQTLVYLDFVLFIIFLNLNENIYTMKTFD